MKGLHQAYPNIEGIIAKEVKRAKPSNLDPELLQSHFSHIPASEFFFSHVHFSFWPAG